MTVHSASDGYDVLAPLSWHVTGRTVYKYAKRLGEDPRASKLRKMGADLTKACRTMVCYVRLRC